MASGDEFFRGGDSCARRALGVAAIQSGEALVVPSAAGNNAMLVFAAK